MNALNQQTIKKLIRLGQWVGWGLISIIIIGGGTLVIGVYIFKWQGDNVQSVLRYVPLPAARVNWQPLWYQDFLQQEQALLTYNTTMATANANSYRALSTNQIRGNTVNKLVRDYGTTALGKKYRLTVSSADIDQAYTSQVLQGGNREEVIQMIKKLYNWTPEQFKKYVLKISVLRDKLREKYSYDDSLNGQVRQTVSRVTAALADGQKTFEEIAREFGQDTAAAVGGDLGFIPRGQLTSELDDVAFTIPIDQVSQVIHTKYGWHVIKVLERKTVDGQEQAHLEQIFIAAPSVDQAVTDYLQTRQVKIYVPGYTYDNTAGLSQP